MLLVCQRGVKDRNYGKVYTMGGSIDRNERPEVAAAREAAEESGVVLDPRTLTLFQQKEGCAHHYAVLSSYPRVPGPSSRHEFEVIFHSRFFTETFGVPCVNGWAWVDAQQLLTYLEGQGDEYVVLRTLRALHQGGVF